ncbi:MAG: YceI family protein [Chitinophagaceae bacterium]|nr:YceI family protein [Chitinophagaceae bacterium]
MKLSFKTFAALSIITFTSAFVAVSANWNLDANYNIRFTGSKVEGTISGLTGKAIFDPSSLKDALIDVEVDATSIKTGNSLKDDHAKGSDWLDTEKFPKIKFRSIEFKTVKEGYEVRGNLEIHGTTKAINIPFQFAQADGKGLFTGKFKIDRKEYGVKGNFMASSMSGEIEIELKIPVTKK